MSRASILARLLRRAINGCHRRGKQLIVRNWGAYRDPQNPQGHLLYEALAQARAPKSVLVMDKAYEPDFALGYPFNAGLRQLASRHPTVVELELAGEQEGMDTVPVASPQESQVAVEQALACGCRGFVVRVDSSPDTTQWWHTHRTLDTVNEINLYACLRLIQEPTVTLQAVWSEWAQRFGAAADAVIALLQPTFALGQRLYLCQGNLFSNSPYSVAHATRNLRHYSRYRYTRTPADRYWQTVLPAADAGALGELLAEKRAACRGYEAGYQLACRLSGLPRKWQRLFEDGFRHGADVARVYLYFAEMVVRYARWQQDGSAAERRRLLRLVAVAEAHLAAGAFPNRRLGRVVAGQMDMVVMARRQLQRFSARLAESD